MVYAGKRSGDRDDDDDAAAGDDDEGDDMDVTLLWCLRCCDEAYLRGAYAALSAWMMMVH